MERTELVKGLREAAQFIEDHPELPLPRVPRFDIWDADKEDLAAFARAGGRVEKQSTDDLFYLSRRFTAGVRLDINASRDDVCERVQVGTRVVEGRPAELVPATETREEPVYEWKCPSLLKESVEA